MAIVYFARGLCSFQADPELLTEMKAAHHSYAEERWAMLTVRTRGTFETMPSDVFRAAFTALAGWGLLGIVACCC